MVQSTLSSLKKGGTLLKLLDRDLSRNEVERQIRKELSECGIPVVDILAKDVTDIHSTIGGKLGEFSFFRYMSSWTVAGKFPVGVAREIYRHPVGKISIRVGDGFSTTNPAGKSLKWFTRQGKQLVSLKEKIIFEQLIKTGQLEKSVIANFEFVKTRDFPKLGEACVTNLGVDSIQGLSLVVETLRKYKLI